MTENNFINSSASLIGCSQWSREIPFTRSTLSNEHIYTRS